MKGTDGNLSQFQQALPKSWQSLVVGNFSVNMNANHQEILAEALKVGAKAEEKREAALVEKMITAAAKSADGVVGLRDTLHATHEGSVQTLLFDEKFHAPGYRCESCQYITPEFGDACPFCSGSFAELPDATEIAVRQVMLSGGVVEIVRDNPEMANLGIGALLRY